MKNKKIIILTGNNNFFGQTRKPWVSMDVKKMQAVLEKHDFTVKIHSFHEIVNGRVETKDCLIFYTFSQKLNRRNYIKDVIQFLDNGSNILIPSYELLLCHENKGYQELYKKKINLTSLKSFYLSSVKELENYPVDFPVVLKTTDSSNGKGVFLANTNQELIKLINKLEKQNIFTLLDLVRRKYFRKNKTYQEYPDYSNRKDYFEYRDYILNESNFILQEFVPDLDFDYRVLVLSDRYYVEKRYNRKNDFRASGAKKFDLNIEFDPNLLYFAKNVYDKFNTPFLSIDIGIHQNNYYLFEFQALHFGLNVFVKSSGYYKYENHNWKFNKSKPDIENEIADGLVKYINNRFS